jgi:group I intron endonuclease
MGYIYKIINKINGMIYIGQTIQTLEERWQQHRKSNSNCRYLKSAFKKYGIDQFEFKLICICFDKELDKFETQYIKTFNSMVPNGYNLRNGGNSSRHHEETKKKISETLKGRTDIIRPKTQLGKPHTEETKQKISNSLKGRTDIIRRKASNWIGKHHSEESKNKMAESHKIYTSINQYDLNNIFIKCFSSISEASKETNVDKTGILKCCKNIRKKAGGFKWRF